VRWVLRLEFGKGTSWAGHLLEHEGDDLCTRW
jgi:hypothetical protein